MGEINVLPMFLALMGEGVPNGIDECFAGVSVING